MTSNTAGLPDDEDIIINIVIITNIKIFIFVNCCLLLFVFNVFTRPSL